jgi:hypothetical protein
VKGNEGWLAVGLSADGGGATTVMRSGISSVALGQRRLGVTQVRVIWFVWAVTITRGAEVKTSASPWPSH